ncbi:hypothetical protein V5E97_24790 [Singulisphaera sp. Ch08]|uniref:Uncharacterized protein n=1 Tax=Singulisphaera sp. Ch08 TaxID=3120278 RepID=A0AAU7C8R4_9BACT
MNAHLLDQDPGHAQGERSGGKLGIDVQQAHQLALLLEEFIAMFRVVG